MKTYIAPKPFVDHPGFQPDRQSSLYAIDITQIEKLLRDLVADFDLFDSNDKVEYRLAYIAFCIENSPSGKKFAQQLKDISLTVEQGLVQFSSAQWFWDQWVNSYALQIMSKRFKDQDSVVIDFHEAQKLKQARDFFFEYLKNFTSTILEEVNNS